jgi:hypothetical protein
MPGPPTSTASSFLPVISSRDSQARVSDRGCGRATLYTGSNLPHGEGNIVLYKKVQGRNTEVLRRGVVAHGSTAVR